MDAPIDVQLTSGRRATIAVQIYRHLRRQIVAGDYVPLQSLSENELAALFRVSRTPIREALGKLEEEKLVSILPQYGTFVAPIVIDRVFSDQFVREAIECAAIGEAAARCTAEDAAALRAIIAEQRSAPSEREFFAADETMHRTLITVAGQEAAWQVVDAAKVNLDRIRHLAARHTFKRRSILTEHERIIEAVIAHDREGAVVAMRTHLRGVFASSQQMMRMHPEFFQGAADPPRPVRRKRPSPGGAADEAP
ncbi:GntR family transcriptional regulator [Aliidongia dinghuensis]|uniref:GntR family transcriptional regulator n=1 Tax=Aliidongia dinghuensis TaxID=1867774 RepID=A0A8J2YTM3_9PROT|nr:GntR family transcriptional regulator [Aliidongia dinghuensis]GGF19714.1 GntR family transcriptional regulator [Aliidongia dinghuensis]